MNTNLLGMEIAENPADSPGSQEIQKAISAATKEAVSRVPFIDRREASTVRCQFLQKQAQVELQKKDKTAAEQTVVKMTGQIAALDALLRKYRKLLDKQPTIYSPLVDETNLKINKIRHNLEFETKDLDRITRILDSHEKLLQEWLVQTPGKGYPTNLELLKQQDELKKLEADAANELRAASF
jgi:hypothetical protein